MQWINVKDRLPEQLQEVAITFLNHEPEPYYSGIKDVTLQGFAVYYRGNWHWWSSVTVDMLAEYGDRYRSERLDAALEVIAWAEIQPYEG